MNEHQKDSSDPVFEKLDAISTRLQQLELPYADALAHRVYQTSVRSVFATALLLFGAIATITTIMGIQLWERLDQKINGLTDDYIEKRMGNSIQAEVDLRVSEMRSDYESKIDSTFQDLFGKLESISASANVETTELNAKVAELREQTKSAIGQAAKTLSDASESSNSNSVVSKVETEINKTLDTPTSADSVIRTDGVCYFGLWLENNECAVTQFNEDHSPQLPRPKVGDVITALHHINVRKDMVRWLSESGTWSDVPVVDQLDEGDEVIIERIKEFNTPRGQHIWIEFKRPNKALQPTPSRSPV